MSLFPSKLRKVAGRGRDTLPLRQEPNEVGGGNGLDLAVGSGHAPDFMGAYSSSVHFVNNVAYGRRNGGTYTSAFIYNNTDSTISETIVAENWR